MTPHKDFVRAIENCRTSRQVYDFLKINNFRVFRDDSEEAGCFSIWLDDVTRIYKPCNSKTMRIQYWNKVKMEYSGIPTFFG